ncbi:hypothetical protein HB976_15335 [Yersinia mollaretii]|uniref:hypothetical protein n=1 Tax=Yersinia mollaretii TaxID=33060 RepID=UPI001427C9BF|nr:hypothetical protein [Yersinia mollaretii]MDA5536050.1 hypothetical protein [Yersinia mollaretii]NIL04315.1 hypothetical protein [Yersinia mollaretii]
MSSIDSVDSIDSDFYKKNQLISWEKGLLDGKFHIIHAISSEQGLAINKCTSPFVGDRFEKVVSKWDIMSGSLVSYSEGKGRGAFPTHLVLEIPYQNILGTHFADVCFPNHAGKSSLFCNFFGNLCGNKATGKLKRPYSLVDKINKGKQANGLYLETSYRILENFHDFIEGMEPDIHNEILIVCKPNILIIEDVPSTGEIKLKDIVYDVDNASFKNIKKDVLTIKKIAVANDLKTVTFIFNNKRIIPFEKKHICIYDEIRKIFGAPIYSSFKKRLVTENNFLNEPRKAVGLSNAYFPLGLNRDIAVFSVNGKPIVGDSVKVTNDW